MKEAKTNILKRIHMSTFVFAILIFCVFLFTTSLVLLYIFPGSGNITNRLKSSFPYPLVVMDYTNVITFRSLATNMASVRRFYETQDFSKIGLRVDFSTEDGKKRFKIREKEVLNKMIEDLAIKKLASAQGIFVGSEEAKQSVARKLEEYGTRETVKQELDRLYRWTLADFEEKIVIPGLYQEKLEKAFTKNTTPDIEKAREKALEAQKEIRAGTSFSEVAKKYSDDKTDEEGQWFALSDILPELQPSLVKQAVGTTGDVIESRLGFHIVLLKEQKKEDTKTLYLLKQIFVKRMTFAEYLSEQMQKMSVVVLVPEYTWDKESARIEFTHEDMKEFEKKLYETPGGDPAFFF
ncbi:MAG: hypothetical protein GW815_02215 [Candidatus Moranbacteria bacterium]|nr:hypothetical protein [Candidatus Moranbacteria bacterium]OIQ03514.1 MAG: hypothetical protein AUK58_01865 [Candidatus Moranbacteria bacterium CG2_30_41_165]